MNMPNELNIPPQPARTSQGTNKSYVPAYRENIAVTALMLLPRKTSQVFGFLSSVPGFKAVIAPFAATYALMLGVEAVYLALPIAAGVLAEQGADVSEFKKEEVLSQMRFVPKIGIEDGAELHRLFPIRQTKNLVSETVGLPQWVSNRIPGNSPNVWDNPFLFLFAFGVTSLIQYYERQIQSPKKLSQLKQEFSSANSQKKVKADPDAIWLAQKKAAQVNSYGTGKTAIDAFAVATVYGLELAAFLSTFKAGNASLLVVALYAAYTIFGFEMFSRSEAEN